MPYPLPDMNHPQQRPPLPQTLQNTPNLQNQQVPQNTQNQQPQQQPPQPPRRTSLGMLLRRSKSGDLGKGGSNRKASKEQQQQLQQQQLQQQQQQQELHLLQESVSQMAPRLPELVRPDERLSSTLPADMQHNMDDDDNHQDYYDGGAYSGRTPMSGRPSIDPGRPSIDPGRPSVDLGRSMVSTMMPMMPPVPDPYARTESMTNRGRYSYASSALSTMNNPRRVRRRKDPTPFNILLIGTKGAGKTSFIEFLKTSLVSLPTPPSSSGRKRFGAGGGAKSVTHEDEEFAGAAAAAGSGVVAQGAFVPHYVETEIDGERVGLTLWDSEGLERNVVDLQLREMSTFLESKFEDTFAEEMKVIRSPGARDTHIHAVLLVLDPTRLDRNLRSARNTDKVEVDKEAKAGCYSPSASTAGALDDDLDLQVLRTLQSKTTVIPIIAKADTVTARHMAVLKRAVWESLKKSDLDPLEALGMMDEEDDSEEDGAEGGKDHQAADDGDDGEAQQADDDSAIDTSRIAGAGDDHEAAALIKAAKSNAEGDNVSDVSKSSGMEYHQDHEQQERGQSAAAPLHHRRSAGSIQRYKAAEEKGMTKGNDKNSLPFLPLSVISPDMYDTDNDGSAAVGRHFPWGFADPYNKDHCDFVRLKDSVFSEWRAELRETSRERWYEGWRTSRLKHREAAPAVKAPAAATGGAVLRRRPVA